MGHPDFPPHVTEKLPIDTLLEVIGFLPHPSGLGYVQRRGIVEFQAFESFSCWFLSRSYIKRSKTPPHSIREIGWPYEILLPKEMAAVELMAIIYPLWAKAHPGEEPRDFFLIQGKEWLDYQRELKLLVPPPPTVWADREFLRFCLTYIERQHDWIDADYEIRFARIPGQIKITANDTEVYCPAHGNWVGESIVQAKELFRSLPKRFMGNVVTLQALGSKIGIDNHKFRARWLDVELE